MQPTADVRRFRDALIYNWAIAAPDAHARNYSVFLDGSNVALAPMYDIISYLPDADGIPHWKLHTAMKIGENYKLRSANRPSAWQRTAKLLGLPPDETTDRAQELIRDAPAAISDAIDALSPQDRASRRLPILHQSATTRSQDVLGEFRSAHLRR